MFDVYYETPGLLFVTATLIPLASFVLLLLAAGTRAFLKQYRGNPTIASIHQLLGGEVTGRGPAYVALGAIALSFILSVTGFVTYLMEAHGNDEQITRLQEQLRPLRDKAHHEATEDKKLHSEIEEIEREIEGYESRWAGNVVFASVRSTAAVDPDSASALRIGFRIDMLAAIMFTMVTFIASLIHLFSMGYMDEELHQVVEDHEVHTSDGHLKRRGRFGRFFLYLSLFCFSMLNLIVADNLFQVFVSWELVGVCSYLLIGFYFERTSASNAANKAFITNRIGDAGFIIGVLILWTYVGTLNFQEIFSRVRAPEVVSHGVAVPKDSASMSNVKEAAQIIRVDRSLTSGDGNVWLVKGAGESGTDVLLFPRVPEHLTFRGAGSTIRAYAHPTASQYGYIPYWMLVAAGLGIFLGCMGKSAQFPLHVWLPDAMEGPTPVSALIHAATMVAAGVYLVGRCYPLFTSEVLLTIAYIGAITLTMAASIAVVMTDIKKVLAYSTVSQLGYMMLGLGVGGWVAGLFHLLTHAFFKALMFLASGSVIYGCHHVQEMGRMGGLYRKMKITAITMLVGCLAIAGIPLFSGWYSKDAILAQAYGFALVHKEHFLLFLLPLLTAGLTTFYMFRMWFMTFAGKPRDEHVYEHAHETPWMMTGPLIALAVLSVVVGWGWPIWNPEASWLEHQLRHEQPHAVLADYGHVLEEGEFAPGNRVFPNELNTRLIAAENHGLAGFLALGIVLIGLSFATMLYYFEGILDPAEAKENFAGVHRFLAHKWYFDEFYSAALVRPALVVSGWCKRFDFGVIDGFVHLLARFGVWSARISGLFDKYIVDGLANLIARVSYRIGIWLRGLQTGYIRSYVLFLVLAAVSIWVLLSFFLGSPSIAVSP